MAGLIRGITGGESAAEKARKQQARADTARAQATATRKESESEAALSKAKKKRRTIGRRSTILTSPLGIQDTGLTQTLG